MQIIPKFKNIYRRMFFFLVLAWVFFFFGWILTLLSWLMLQQFNNLVVAFPIAIFIWVIAFLNLLIAYFRHYTEYILLDETGISQRSGWFFVRKSHIPYFKINNVILENFFWFHDIKLETGNDTTDINFRSIEKGSQLKAEIESMIMKVNGQSTQLSPELDELEHLNQLLIKGVLNYSEFQSEKKKILSK